jgi:sugar phosphate isomerase/epimerase
MSAQETADALKSGGIHHASLCRFFPNADQFGDPLGFCGSTDTAFQTILSDLQFIRDLRQNGITITHMTGPSAYVLAHQYKQSPGELMIAMTDFGHRVEQAASAADVVVGVEYLRHGEDFALCSMERACELVQNVGSPHLRIQADIFHMLQRGEVPWQLIDMAGDYLAYLHAQGSLRLAPGAFKYSYKGQLHTDEANWHLIGKALKEVSYKGPVVSEPFGKPICDEINALGDGVVIVDDPVAYYNAAYDHLEKNGVLSY